MGYVSQTATAGTSRTGYVSQTAGVPGAEPEGHSVLGFLGNLIGGVKDVTLGLGKLIVAPAADAVRAATDWIPGVDIPGGYMTDDIIKGLAAMPQDYWDRYSPLLPGGRPASQFLEEVYQKPVSFGLDALAVASLAGKAAGAAGLSKYAAEAGLEGKALGAFKRTLGEVPEGVNISTRTAKLANIRKLLEDSPTPTPSYAKLLPEWRQVRIGSKELVPSTTLRNPLLAAGQKVLETKLGKYSTMESLDVFKSKIIERADQFNTTPEKRAAYILREEGIARRAEEAGVKTIDRAPVYMRRASTTVGALQRLHSGAWFRDRLKELGAIKNIVKPALDKMDETAKGASDMRSMDANLLLDSTDLNTPIAIRAIEDSGGMVDEGGHAKVIPLESPDVPSGVGGTAVGVAARTTELVPEVVTKVQEVVPDMRPDEAMRIVQEHLDETLTDTEGLEAMGWDAERIAAEVEGAERTKSWLVREAEKIASGEADEQFIMDARLRVKDIIDHEAQFKTMQESPALMLERSYGPMREVNGFEGSWQQLDDAVWNAGETAPGYFPMVDANRVGPGDWGIRTPGSKKSLEAASDPHLKHNEQILFREGRYIRDPLKARLTRAARHARADGTLRYIEGVLNSKVGRVLEAGERLAPDEVAIPLEQLRGRNAFSKFFYDARLKHMAAGLNDADATLEAMKELMDDIHRKIENGEMDPGAMRIYAVPKKVGDRLSATARAAGIINGPVAKVYFQGPMNAWRSLVLAGSPRWIVNNVLGNAVMTIMQGAPVTRAFHLMEQRYKEILNEKYGWNLKHGFLDEVRKNLDDAKLGDSYGTTVADEVGGTYSAVEANTPNYIPGVEAVPGPGGKIVMKTRSLRGRAEGLNRAERKTNLSRGERALNRGQRIGDAVRAFNGEVETAFRMNSALTAAERVAGIGHMKRMMGRFKSTEERMNRIFRDGLTEAEARVVVKEMNFFLGNFSDLGPWERNLIRPYIFPFWGFYKHTAKLLLSYPFEYPERALVLGGLASVTQDMMDAYGPMPSWMDAAMPLAPPGTGDQPFLMTSGPNPFSGLFQSPLGGLSPLLKIPIEHFTGRNLFTGQQFSDKDTITPFGTEQQFKIIRDENGKPIGTEPVDKVTPSLWEHMLSQIPQYELIKDAAAGGKTFDTSGIIDALTHEGLIKDETGKAKYPLGTAQAVAKFAGFSQMPFDYSAYQTWLGEQQQAALTEALNREGYGAA